MKKALSVMALLALSCGSSDEEKVLQAGFPSVYKRIEVTTKDGSDYKLDVLCKRKGVAVVDTQKQVLGQLHFFEADTIDRYKNIEVGDYFVLCDKKTKDTHIIRYDGVNIGGSSVYFTNVSEIPQSFAVTFGAVSRIGYISINGIQYRFHVEAINPNRLGIDQDNTQVFNGDESSIIDSRSNKITLDSLIR